MSAKLDGEKSKNGKVVIIAEEKKDEHFKQQVSFKM